MKQFSVTDYLRDIDQEMLGHRQEIAKHQVRIQQLADMRVLMMSREEDRAAMNGLASPFGTLPNGAEIAVRDPLTYQPYQPASALAAPPPAKVQALTSAERKKEREHRRESTPERRNYKSEYARRKAEERRRAIEQYGTDEARANAGLSIDKRLDEARRGVRGARAKVGRHRMYADPVMALFQNYRTTPLTAKQVIEAIFPGRAPDKAAKQAIYQTLFDLKSNGVITQERQGMPYALVPHEAAAPQA